MLTEEDKFLMQLTKVERLATKLSIMNYMGNFMDNLHLITPVSLFKTMSLYAYENKLTLIVYIVASASNHISFKFGKEFQEITPVVRSHFSIWQLYEQC